MLDINHTGHESPGDATTAEGEAGSLPNVDLAEQKIAAARSYLDMGALILPIHSPRGRRACSCGKYGCGRAGKHPISDLAPNGTKSASNDPAKVRAWFEARPEANIGVVPPDDVIVLDVDPRNGGDETLAALEAEGIDFDTHRYKSGSGGQHIWYRLPPGSLRPYVALKGIDLKTSSGYVIVPPSMHVEGPYSVIDPQLPKTIPDDVLRALERSGRTNSPSRDELKLDGQVPEGGRHNYLVSLAGSLRNTGVLPQTLAVALKAENAAVCSPPLDDEEVEAIADSAENWDGGTALALALFGADAQASRAADVALSVLESGSRAPSRSKLSDLLTAISGASDQRDADYGLTVIEGRLSRIVGYEKAKDLIRLASPPDSGESPFAADPDIGLVIKPLGPAKALLDRRWLVEDYIPAGGVGAIFAEYSTGKTWLCVSLGLSVAFGTEWLAIETDQAPVIFLLAEGNHEFPKRIYSWLVHHGHLNNGATLQEMFDLLEGRVVINELPVRFDDPDFEEAVLNSIGSMEAGLVIIDTFGKTLGRDQSEDSNDVANDINGSLSRIAALTGATFLLTHHVGHSNKARARGASAFEQGLDFAFAIKGTKQDLAKGYALSLKSKKMRDAAFPPTLGYRLEPVEQLRLKGQNGRVHSFDSACAVSATLTHQESPLVVRVFAAIGGNPGISQAKLHESVTGQKARITNTVKELIDAGAVENRGHDTRHAYHAVPDYRVRPNGEIFSAQERFAVIRPPGDDE